MVYSVEDMKGVFIGRRGEKGARKVLIDVSSMTEEFPGATIKLLMHQAQSVPYECSVSVADGILTWSVGELDTSYAGDHPFEIRAIKTGVIVKSKIGFARVDQSIYDAEGDPPDAIETWVDQLEELVEAFPESSTSDDLNYILGV